MKEMWINMYQNKAEMLKSVGDVKDKVIYHPKMLALSDFWGKVGKLGTESLAGIKGIVSVFCGLGIAVCVILLFASAVSEGVKDKAKKGIGYVVLGWLISQTFL